MFARGVKRIEQLVDVLEAEVAVDAPVHAPADLHLRIAPTQDRRDERRGRRDDIRRQIVRGHVVKRRRNEVGQRIRHRIIAVAIAVEKRIEAKSVLTRPAKLVEHPRLQLVGEIRRGTTAQDARPREEDLADAVQIRLAHRRERLIVKPSDGQRAAYSFIWIQLHPSFSDIIGHLAPFSQKRISEEGSRYRHGHA